MSPIEARALKLAESRLEDERGLYEWALDAEITLRECAAALSALRDVVKQEPPYAYIYEWDGPFGLHQSTSSARYNGMAPNRSVPVFTIPQAPKAEPVLLSDAEIEEIVSNLMVSTDGYVRFSASLRQFARAVEAEVIRRGGGQS